MTRMACTVWFVLVMASASGCQGDTDGGAPGWDEAGIGQGCTVIYLTDGETSLGGNNEDYVDPTTRVWFVPGDDGDYGRVYFGFANFFPQGGMNDQGLFFDAMAIDEPVTVPQGDRESYGYQLADIIMAECATVACAIDYFDAYHLADTWAHQFLFGDATGQSAIIEPRVVLPLEGNYQVGTNFYQSTTSAAGSGCWRYPIAVDMLEEADEVSVDVMRDVLDAVHFDEGSPTLYSNVYDLNNHVVYLYLYHDYDHPVIIDLEEELARGLHAYEIAALFPSDTVAGQWATRQSANYQRAVAEHLDPNVSPDMYEGLTGQYEIPSDATLRPGTMSIVRDGDTLWMLDQGGLHYELHPRSDTSFFQVAFIHYEYRIQFDIDFTVDEDGNATSLALTYEDTTTVCERTETAEPTVRFIPLIDPSAAPEPSETPTEPMDAPVETLDAPEAPTDAGSGDNTALWWVVAIVVVLISGGVGVLVGLRSGRSGGTEGKNP